MSKKKILYVIPGLQRAGAEKYLYELLLALDKSKFEPHILTTHYVHLDTEFPHYYYHKLKNSIPVSTLLHQQIVPLQKLRNALAKNWVGRKTGNVAYRVVNKIQGRRHQTKIRKLLSDFDLVSVIDSPAYPFVKRHLQSAKKFDLHLMSHAAQFDYDVFAPFDKNKALNIVYIDPYQLDNLRNAGLKVAKSVYFPPVCRYRFVPG